MSVENSFKIQQQVRENSEELQNYLKDLESWEKAMRKKEEELKLLKITEEDNIPPVRNTLARSKRKSKHKKDKKKSDDSARIKSFNYKAWEKFDVETELKKLDEDEKAESSSGDSDSEEILNLQRKKQQAILKKDKGNEYFKNGSYDSAINCYTIGMELDPENALLPANRAMAFLKKEQFASAEDDCTVCLSLDPTYIKAYLRRATARRALKKFLLAEEDYLKILELEPQNKSAQTELEKMRQEMENSDVKESSTEKLNLDIENIKIKENTEIQTPSSRLESLLNVMDSKQSVSHSYIVPEEKTTQSSPCQLPTRQKSLKDSPDVKDLREIESIVKKLEQTLPPVPNAAYQFLTDWRKLSKYPDLKYQYLKQFPPERLPIVFKHDMEAEIFRGILQTLGTSYLDNQDDVFVYLKYLTQVGRFQTLVMFLSSQDKKDLKKLLGLKNSLHSSSEVESLLKQYKL
nr:RNA polymerase II-associated protein 3 isoform X2 [Parasteatoda tepidariorum]